MLHKIVTVTFLATDGDEEVFDRAIDHALDFIHDRHLCCGHDCASVSGDSRTRRVDISVWNRHEVVDGIIRWAQDHYRDVRVQIEYDVY